MAKSSLLKFLTDRDIFGQPITVLYKGSDTYKTKLGAFCTILVTVIVLINTVILAQGFISQDLQTESGQIEIFDRGEAGKFYLEENSVNFKILSLGILDEKLGRFKVTFTYKDSRGPTKREI